MALDGQASDALAEDSRMVHGMGTYLPAVDVRIPQPYLLDTCYSYGGGR